MKILAINFGHDASFALFENGTLSGFLELERFTRLKHNVGVKAEDISFFLKEHNCDFSQINCIALAGTQWYKAKHSEDIEIEYGFNDHCKIDFHNANILKSVELGGTDKWYDYAEHANRLEGVKQTEFPLSVITECNEDKLNIQNPIRNVVPYTFKALGQTKPAIFVGHQLAHACYGGFYRSSDVSYKLVISHDGGWPHIEYNSGGIFLLSDHQLIPVCDERLALGQLYQIMGERAGFKPAEAPGKLMGLASYGVVNSKTLGDLKRQYYKSIHESGKNDLSSFMANFNKLCDDIQGSALDIKLRPEVHLYDFSFSNKTLSIGIAAYTQKLVEQIWVETMAPKIEEINISTKIQGEVAIVGGFSLNCPSNSLLQSSVSVQIKPLAGGGDMGISIGAGVYANGMLTGIFPKDKSESRDSAAYPPRGNLADASVVVDEVISKQLKKVHSGNTILFYAQKIIEGKIFCHYELDSEVGPRALGRRSIIGHAISDKIRDKININKRREMWRPLAPIVRAEDFNSFFTGSDTGQMADFMLSTYRVLDSELLKGVSHADKSARVQVVYDGTIFKLLSELNLLNAVPVVINTSFNVAGEPLVESVENAVKSFINLDFDYIFINGEIYEKR